MGLTQWVLALGDLNPSDATASVAVYSGLQLQIYIKALYWFYTVNARVFYCGSRKGNRLLQE